MAERLRGDSLIAKWEQTKLLTKLKSREKKLRAATRLHMGATMLSKMIERGEIGKGKEAKTWWQNLVNRMQSEGDLNEDHQTEE